jgi:hypothetical protein
LARLNGVDIDDASAQVQFTRTARGPRLTLTELSGNVENAAFKGEVNLDAPRRAWSVRLSVDGAPSERLLQLAERWGATPQRGRTLNRSLPLRGSLRGVVSLSGDFGGGANVNLLAPHPRDGQVMLTSDALQWRGRELGSLAADLTLREGIVTISDFSLLRRLSAKERALVASAPAVSGSAAAEDAAIGDIAVVRASGTLPVNFVRGGAPFDARFSVENERFSVLREVLEEVRSVLEERGQRVANLDVLLRRVHELPTGLEGRVQGRAHLSGEAGNVSVAVDALVDNARLSTQPLPALETSLVFANGAIDVNAFELKQTFFDVGDDGAPIAEAERVRETALRVAPGGRIVPGGEISLDVDVLRANLSQLAGWLPELRQIGGKTLLRGELSLFSLEVSGQTDSPNVTGSIEARDLSYRGYTLDRLRVTRFDIANGTLSVAPGNLTIVKGGFQSAVAYGSVPWSWGENGSLPGPKRNGVLDVHLPLQTRDFGALAGAFVPAVTSASAEEFNGSVDVTGTIDAPRFAGAITFAGARFRSDPAAVALPFGVSGLRGTVRFVDGNRVLIEGLSGQLARAEAVRATSTGNRSAAERDASAALRQARLETNAEQRGREVARPYLGGTFTLGGEVVLNLDADDLGSGLATHRYDLDFGLKDGTVYSESFSGLRDVSLTANWKTGEGRAEEAQNLSWNLSARGRTSLGTSQSGGRGNLVSAATVRLAPNFASSAAAFLRSRFDGQLELKSLPVQMRDVGRGVLDGKLRFDNGTVPLRTTPRRPDTLTTPVVTNTSAQIARPTKTSTLAGAQASESPKNSSRRRQSCSPGSARRLQWSRV